MLRRGNEGGGGKTRDFGGSVMRRKMRESNRSRGGNWITFERHKMGVRKFRRGWVEGKKGVE